MADHPAIARLRERFAGVELSTSEFRGDQTVVLPRNQMHEMLMLLRDDPACGFDQLMDLTCIDYLHFRGASDRYAVTYLLLSVKHNHRLRPVERGWLAGARGLRYVRGRFLRTSGSAAHPLCRAHQGTSVAEGLPSPRQEGT